MNVLNVLEPPTGISNLALNSTWMLVRSSDLGHLFEMSPHFTQQIHAFRNFQDSFSLLPSVPYKDSGCALEYSLHVLNLMAFFTYIGLVDADAVSPQ